MRKMIFLGCISFCCFYLSAGTLMFKDGSRLSDVKILSISEGMIVVEKDKVKKSFSLSKISEYYSSDIKSSDDSEEALGFCDYTVSIIDVKMPNTGVGKESKTSECEVTYRVSRTGDNKTNKVKAPYFYIYVLTSGSDDYGTRKIVRYYYPDEAKPKGKGYDKGAILEVLNSFKRPTMYFEGNDVDMSSRKLSKIAGEREFRIALKDVKNRRILAYHIEVWGNDSILKEEDWKQTGIKADRWWERY